LMLLSWQIMTRLANGEKKDSPGMLSLLSQQQAMSNSLGGAYQGFGHPYGNALGGLFGLR
jgi:hypothetical protein